MELNQSWGIGCPRCTKEVEVSIKLLGKEVVCPSCITPFLLSYSCFPFLEVISSFLSGVKFPVSFPVLSFVGMTIVFLTSYHFLHKQIISYFSPLSKYERGSSELFWAVKEMNSLYLSDVKVGEKSSKSAASLIKAAALGGVLPAQRSLGNVYLDGNGVSLDPIKGIEWLHKAAMSGDTKAAYELGSLYVSGSKGVPKNVGEGIVFLTKAAIEGDVNSQIKLAKIYYFGNGVKKNLIESLKWESMAALAGNQESSYKVAFFYLFGNPSLGGGDVKKAIWWLDSSTYLESTLLLSKIYGYPVFIKYFPEGMKEFSSSSNSISLQGMNQAEDDMASASMLKSLLQTPTFDLLKEKKVQSINYMLGLLYIFGWQKDYILAKDYFSKAGDLGKPHLPFIDLLIKAESDSKVAAVVSGLFITGLNGAFVDKQLHEVWLEKAASMGDVASQMELANSFSNDHYKELYWYEKAARLGDKIAQYKVGVAYFRGSNGAAMNETLGINYLFESAKKGYTPSCSLLYFIYVGNKPEAYKWALVGAEAGDSELQVKVGENFSEANNGAMAFYWYSRASDIGNRHADYLLGKMYFSGGGIPINVEEGIIEVTKAAEGGDTEAMVFLGNMFSKGENFKKNYIEAKKWYERAAISGNIEGMESIAKLFYAEENYQKSFWWYSKAVQSGSKTACLSLSSMYSVGQGTAKDDKKASYWLNKYSGG